MNILDLDDKKVGELLTTRFNDSFSQIKVAIELLTCNRFIPAERSAGNVDDWWIDIFDDANKQWFYTVDETPYQDVRNEYGILSKFLKCLNKDDKDYMGELYLYLHPEYRMVTRIVYA